MPSVLVVDDFSNDRLLAGGLFERENWTVDYAGDGKEAMSAIEQQMPDIVVTDMVMPEMNGLDLVRSIRDRIPLLPVVLMTSQGSEQLAVEALENGASSYLPKRVIAKELLRVVGRLLSTAKVEQTMTNLMQHISRTESACLVNDFQLIASLARHLRDAIVAFGVRSPADSMRVVTGIDEALTNAYYHGNLGVDSSLRELDSDAFYSLAEQRLREEPYCDRRIHVTSSFSRSAAEITIRDEGEGFDPSKLPDPTDPEYVSRPHGRGVMLMRAFLDGVRFNATGNEVTLLVKRH